MSGMKVKLTWYLGGVLMLGLALFSVSCALIEPPVPEPPVAKIIPPAISHSLEGRSDCRVCHATGVGGAPQFPADHGRRPSDVCITCHVSAPDNNGGSAPTIIPMPVVPSVETTPPVAESTVIDGSKIFAASCAACHGANRQGIPGFAPALTPDSLAARSDTEIRSAIADGRPGTAMPPFKASLSPDKIDALLRLIKSPLP